MKIKLITITELAEILKVNAKTIYQWCEVGQIPCIKLNGCLRFDLEEILDWIKKNSKTPSTDYNIRLAQAARDPRKGGR